MIYDHGHMRIDDDALVSIDVQMYDAQGNLISFEILDASKRVTDTRSVDFQLAE